MFKMKEKLNLKFALSCLFALAVFCLPLSAAYNDWGIPDSSEIRSKLSERWFLAPLSDVRANLPEIYVNSAGQRFQVRLEETDETFAIFVAPSTKITVNVYTSKGVTKEEQETFPGDIAGSWVLIRNKQTEKAELIRYYFMLDSEVYVQFSPYAKTSLADFVVFGNYAAKGVSTGIPFTKFYAASFQKIREFTQTSLPWNYVTIPENSYASILQMAGMIQSKLPLISYVYEAMYDENEKLISIKDGNPLQLEDERTLCLGSAGFIKWIADGLVEPVAGSKLRRAPLVQKTVEIKENGYQGVLSQKYSLYFALDWIRNAASAVMSVYTGKDYLFDESGVDVTVSPFAASVTSAGTANTVTFVEENGYQIKLLKSLLYVLASTEPDTLYFGAIRGTDRTVTPEIKSFNECVVFLPYFTDTKRFSCYVFMNGHQMTLEDFCMIYAEDFVYLTRVRAYSTFFPEPND